MPGITTLADEKQDLDHLEDTLKPDDEAAERFNPKEAAAIRRRIDFRLIPCLGLMYFVSLMDRKNVANAAIAGMRTDLDMLEGYRYSLMTLVFFITYTLLQPPMTIICRKIGPRNFLPAVCLLWGAVIIGFGFSQKWTTLVALRLILGILEAGYFPGCVYLLSTWYTRCKMPLHFPFSLDVNTQQSRLHGGTRSFISLAISDLHFQVSLLMA
jgi:sugar phosphate permease